MPSRKIYFSDTVEAAVAAARQELGGDALLIGSSRSSPESRHRGLYQIEFEAPVPEAAQAAAASPQRGEGSGESGEVNSLRAMRAELTRLSDLITQLASGGARAARTPELAPLAAQLAASDLPPEPLHSILNCVARRLGLPGRPAAPSHDEVTDALLAEVRQRLASAHEVIPPGSGRRVIALVGPAGCGKTTTLAKLATCFGVAVRRPSILLSIDAIRVAAADQLRSYSAILGLPFLLAETPGSLIHALNESRAKELVFLDTPGFSRNDWGAAQEWARVLQSVESLEIHLVLPATAKSADLMAALEWWRIFSPSALIFTHLDETDRYGGCVGVALASRLPVSFLTAGQGIPEDLEEASPERFAGLLFQRQTQAKAAVA
jgi:flagellar biosynthesis protein FlhF